MGLAWIGSPIYTVYVLLTWIWISALGFLNELNCLYVDTKDEKPEVLLIQNT